MVKSVLLVTRRNITEAIRGASVLLDPLGDRVGGGWFI